MRTLKETKEHLRMSRWLQDKNTPVQNRYYIYQGWIEALEWVFGGEEKKVKIEVIGGVAYVTEKPAGIEVEVFDHDNESREEGSGKAVYAAEDTITPAISEKILDAIPEKERSG